MSIDSATSSRKIFFYDLLFLMLIGLVLNSWLLAGDGYFSIDELELLARAQTQSLHFLIIFAFADTILFRPFDMIYLSIPFHYGANPFFVKLLSLIPHVMCGLLLYILLLNQIKNRQIALISSLLFLVSPNALYTPAWVISDGSFWVLFTLFGLLATQHYLKHKHKKTLILIALSSIFAVCSSEAAIISPLLYFLLAWLSGEIEKPHLYKVLFILTMICAVFFVFRLNTIWHAYQGDTQFGPYVMSFGSNVWENIYAYWLFPFYPKAVELYGITTFHNNWIEYSLIFHFALLAIILIYGSWRYVLGYLALYYCMLIPVLLMQNYSTERLYGTALVMSVALGALWARNLLAKFMVVIFCLVLLAHSWAIQKTFYYYATCQAKIITSLSADLLSQPNLIKGNNPVYIYAAPTEFVQFILRGAVFKGELINGQLLNIQATITQPEVPLHVLSNCLVIDNSKKQ